jgi:hypothetical protein
LVTGIVYALRCVDGDYAASMIIEVLIDGKKALEARREHSNSLPRVGNLTVYLLERGMPIAL